MLGVVGAQGQLTQGAILEPNTNAHRMSLLSYLLSKAVDACGRNCYSLLRSFEYGTFLLTIKFSLYHKSQFYTGWARLISTVGSVPPTGQHGRYRRSARLHLRRITVDIDGRFGSKYQKLDDIDHIGRFIQKKNRSTVEIDRRSGHTLKKLKKSVDIDFAYPYFTMSTDGNNCLSHLLMITLNNFKRISLNNMHTHRDLRKTLRGVFLLGRVKSGETLGNGCSSTKSLLGS